MNSQPWNGLRIRMWLVVLAFVAGIITHRPLIGVALALLLAAGGLATYLSRRKQAAQQAKR